LEPPRLGSRVTTVKTRWLCCFIAIIHSNT
jgi:hypothetical protein